MRRRMMAGVCDWQAVDPDAPPTESERAALDALMAEMRREQQQAARVGE